MHVMGLDIGTTGCKAIVFHESGKVLGRGFREYPIISTSKTHEQDAELVWRLAKEAIREAVQKSGQNVIVAMSISVQGDAIIPVDKEGFSLGYAILGMDYRSEKQAEECSEKMGPQALFKMTGMRPHPMNSATKIMWIMENKPQVYKAACKIVTYGDFFAIKLCGEAVIDETMASRTMLYDLSKRAWSPEILEKVQIEDNKLSRVMPSGIPIARVKKSLCEELSIEYGIELVTGGHDQTCAALGAGLVSENIALDSHGTAEVLSTAFYKKRLDKNMFENYYPCYCHAKSDMYFTFSLNHIGGVLLKWFRDEFCEMELQREREGGISAFQQMEQGILAGPSPVMVLPHFNGSGTPWCDFKSKGAFLGLTMSTTKKDIVQAIMESLTYELKMNMEYMSRCSINMTTLRAVGGATRSPIWMQMKADITGVPIQTLKLADAACLGAAMLAGMGSKLFPTLNQASTAWVELDRIYEPKPERVEAYREKYGIYKELYHILKGTNHRL